MAAVYIACFRNYKSTSSTDPLLLSLPPWQKGQKDRLGKTRVWVSGIQVPAVALYSKISSSCRSSLSTLPPKTSHRVHYVFKLIFFSGSNSRLSQTAEETNLIELCSVAQYHSSERDPVWSRWLFEEESWRKFHWKKRGHFLQLWWVFYSFFLAGRLWVSTTGVN